VHEDEEREAIASGEKARGFVGLLSRLIGIVTIFNNIPTGCHRGGDGVEFSITISWLIGHGL
jgi:hypothetical protein